jgi:hypothetical protein
LVVTNGESTQAEAPAPAQAGPAADARWRTRHLPPLLAASAVVMIIAAAVGAALQGPVGAFGAALGVAIATASFTVSTLVVAYADRMDPKLVMPFGMGVYVAKVSLLGGLLLVVAEGGWAGLKPLAWGVAAGVLSWATAQIWWIARVHVPASRRRWPGRTVPSRRAPE